MRSDVQLLQWNMCCGPYAKQADVSRRAGILPDLLHDRQPSVVLLQEAAGGVETLLRRSGYDVVTAPT